MTVHQATRRTFRALLCTTGVILGLASTHDASADFSSDVYTDVKQIFEELVTDQLTNKILANIFVDAPLAAEYYHETLSRLSEKTFGSIPATLKKDSILLVRDVTLWSLQELAKDSNSDVGVKRFLEERQKEKSLKRYRYHEGKLCELPLGTSCNVPHQLLEKPPSLKYLYDERCSPTRDKDPMCAPTDVVVALLQGEATTARLALRDLVNTLVLKELKKEEHKKEVLTVLNLAIDRKGGLEGPELKRFMEIREIVADPNKLSEVRNADAKLIVDDVSFELNDKDLQADDGVAVISEVVCRAPPAGVNCGTSKIYEWSKVAEETSCRKPNVVMPNVVMPNVVIGTLTPTMKLLLNVAESPTDKSRCRLVSVSAPSGSSWEAIVESLKKSRKLALDFWENLKRLGIERGKFEEAVELVRKVRVAAERVVALNEMSSEALTAGKLWLTAIDVAREIKSNEPWINHLLEADRTSKRLGLLQAASRGDVRGAVSGVLNGLLSKEAEEDPEKCNESLSSRKFLLSFASYVLDESSSAGSRVVVRESFRHAGLDMLKCLSTDGYRKATVDRRSFSWEVGPSLRLSWSPNYYNESSDAGFRYAATLDWPTARLRLSRKGWYFLGLQGSIIDFLGPIREIALRKKGVEYAKGEQVWLEFVHPRIDLSFGVPSFSSNLLLVAGLGMRLTRPDKPAADSSEYRHLFSDKTACLDFAEASVGIQYVF